MVEKEHHELPYSTMFLIGAIGVISTLAFSVDIRKLIGKRDKWKCVDCGDKFSDGVMVHASHYNHDKSDPNYNTVEAGRIQCVDCHENYHTLYVGNAREIGLTEAANEGAISLLEATDRGTRQK